MPHFLQNSLLLLISPQRQTHLPTLPTKFLDLLRCSTHKVPRIQQLVQLCPDRLEERRPPDPLDEIIVPAFDFDGVGSFVRQEADFLVRVLPGDAVGAEGHDDLFTAKEGSRDD